MYEGHKLYLQQKKNEIYVLTQSTNIEQHSLTESLYETDK